MAYNTYRTVAASNEEADNAQPQAA